MIYTIGHSNHSSRFFIELLQKYEIEILVDVRSRPYSSYVKQYNKKNIEAVLQANNIDYRFMGNRLGGKPENQAYLDSSGKTQYRMIAEQSWFQDAIDELMALSNKNKIAIMCAEEDPSNCHREKLVAMEIREKGGTVRHIRKEGIERGNDRLDNYFG